ncbi:MAG TPA: alpha/beta hydrolase [Pyrinomonadaceae bacterium]|jgi:pimeloyl-ACP methyl ester carboxylesterase
MKLNDWKESGKYFDCDGLPIFYHLTKNSDEVLLCLHGFPASSFDYHKIWSELAERFAVLSFDLVGYGFSAKPADFEYTTFRQADVLQALLAHLRIKRMHILAHDYGNTITQELLARGEEKRLDFSIETICMLNGALFPETHRPILAQKILISRAGFLFAKLITDRLFKKSLASVFGARTQPTAAELEDFATLFKYNRGKHIAHKLIRYMAERARFRARWVGALETMRQPFRMINGSDDKVSGRHLVERFRQIVPRQTDIVELEGVGHFPHLEAPEIVLDNFFEFHHKN